ncbi:transcriptional regulator, LacI family [Quadrisphaera granulorum]|uniref:LacI family transcriptional regulator n=1 Tax=Quadrisphaera granulorum TaxID=317664 RepID=A0A316AA70_9ACTN|nr:LacI family DNA-binding transcriptional regulator [Quadrisphaera granulorum]PWJ53764.1 LacI family transcriptional regulator [Quadrisphaera granulorum]SZE96521.1 transcriptional regulator, LacI family [Quadrisphaera granulorum]
MPDSLPDGRKRATALDVARLAGVSRTTVSFVFNDRAEARGISPATIQRVLDAAQELGYTPDRAARILRSGVSDLVVFTGPHPVALGAFALEVLNEVSDQLSDEGFHFIMRRARPDRPAHEVWRQLSPAFVVGLELTAADVADLETAGIPVLDANLGTFDDALGTLQARYLLDQGHTALAYATPTEERAAAYAGRRLAAVRRTCEEAGAPAPVHLKTTLDPEAAATAVSSLRDHPGVSAICAYNDDVAFAVLAGMARLGLRAPEDLAVIGSDNIPLSAVAVPSLTTIDPGVLPIANYLTHVVLSAIAGSQPDVDALPPPPTVVVRHSA